MSERTKRLKANMFTGWNPISVEKLKVQVESYKKNAAFPVVIKEARFIEELFEKFPIWIREDELIVGASTARPNALEATFSYGKWNPQEIDEYKKDGFSISEEDEAFLRDAIANFDIMGNMDAMDLAVDERLEKFFEVGYMHPPWPKRKEGVVKGSPRSSGAAIVSGIGPGYALGLYCPNYEKALKVGFGGILEEIRAARKALRYDHTTAYIEGLKMDAMEMDIAAYIKYIRRYSDLARSMAAEENNDQRKKELLEIADICEWVSENPARTFREAMQLFWFVVMLQLPNGVLSFGRPDQFLYPYYKKDIEEGRITDEEVIELFECLRFKCMEQDCILGKANRERADGKAKWFNAVIGGVKKDGSDATNELSYHILEALMRSPTTHHTITLRVAESTPKEILMKAAKCQAMGLSMPAFVSDESYTVFWNKYYNVPLEDARDWCICGCLDAVLPGKQNRVMAYTANTNLMMLSWLNNGTDAATGIKAGPDTPDLDSFTSFEEMYANYVENGMHFYQKMCAERVNLETYIMRDQMPCTVQAVFLDNAIEKGMGLWDPFNDLDSNSFCPVGLVNVAQSMYAIKKLVFDEKVVKLSEYKKAIDQNWEGYEWLREKALALPQYGNNIDEVDEVVARIYKDWADGFDDLPPTDVGRELAPCAISVTAFDPHGKMCGATPDGRCAHEYVADGCASPINGAAKSGFTAMLNSAMKIDQDRYAAFLLNQKFSADSLKSESDLEKFVSVIRTYLLNGGKHVQFIIANQETLLDAQEHPEDHSDLMVRVAGYSAYFTMLSQRVQSQVIERTAHETF